MMRYYWLILGLLLIACHEQNKNKISPAELMKSREIKKVSEAEVLIGGAAFGDEIIKGIAELMRKKIDMDSTDCLTANWTELDSLAAQSDLSIRRIGPQTPEKVPLESELLEAYQYNLENGLKPTPAVQKLDEKTVLYVYPIGKDSGYYKHCLDSVSRTNAQMWSLKIPIKQIINQL